MYRSLSSFDIFFLIALRKDLKLHSPRMDRQIQRTYLTQERIIKNCIKRVDNSYTQYGKQMYRTLNIINGEIKIQTEDMHEKL